MSHTIPSDKCIIAGLRDGRQYQQRQRKIVLKSEHRQTSWNSNQNWFYFFTRNVILEHILVMNMSWFMDYYYHLEFYVLVNCSSVNLYFQLGGFYLPFVSIGVLAMLFLPFMMALIPSDEPGNHSCNIKLNIKLYPTCIC